MEGNGNEVQDSLEATINTTLARQRLASPRGPGAVSRVTDASVEKRPRVTSSLTSRRSMSTAMASLTARSY
jgi:hypothetical protein